MCCILYKQHTLALACSSTGMADMVVLWKINKLENQDLAITHTTQHTHMHVHTHIHGHAHIHTQRKKMKSYSAAKVDSKQNELHSVKI